MRPAQKAPENRAARQPGMQMMRASMRPAQKAPENRRAGHRCENSRPRFNEAGAKSAGKRGSRIESSP